MSAKYIFASGPPAATKGHTIRFLEENFLEVNHGGKILRFVVSDLIRRQFEDDPEFQARALALQAQRELLPCQDIDTLVKKHIPLHGYEILGLDGGPRTAAQVRMFNDYFRNRRESVEMFLVDFGSARDAFFDALFLHTQKAPDRQGRVDGDRIETHRKGVALYRQNRDSVLSTARDCGWQILEINPALSTPAKVLKIARCARLNLTCSQILKHSKVVGIKPLPDSVLRAA